MNRYMLRWLRHGLFAMLLFFMILIASAFYVLQPLWAEKPKESFYLPLPPANKQTDAVDDATWQEKFAQQKILAVDKKQSFHAGLYPTSASQASSETLSQPGPKSHDPKGKFFQQKIRGFPMGKISSSDLLEQTEYPKAKLLLLEKPTSRIDDVGPDVQSISLPVGSRIQGYLAHQVQPENNYPVVLRVEDHLLGPATLTGHVVEEQEGFRLQFDQLAFSDGRSFTLAGFAIDPESQASRLGTASLPLRLLGRLGQAAVETAGLLIKPIMLADQLVSYAGGASYTSSRPSDQAMNRITQSTVTGALGSELSNIGRSHDLPEGMLLHVLITRSPLLQ